MAKVDVWPAIRAERAALAADLEALTADRWAAPSLCEAWSVRDVVAHMAATAKINGALAFFPKLIGSGLRLGRMQEKDIAANLGAAPADTLAAFRSIVDSTAHPPGPNETWLGETIVHAEDIRRPLGIARRYDTAAAVRVADFYKGSNLVIGAKRRIDGVTLRATDVEWSHGTGPEVRGPIVALVMVMAGRKALLADLAGDGVKELNRRA